MRALRFHHARDLRIEDVPQPKDPGPFEVILRVKKCGICGSDLHEYTDGPQLIPTEPHALTGASMPCILGHEFTGEVTSIGDQVRAVQVGDRVSIIPHINKDGEYFSCRNLGHVSKETALVGFSYPWGGLAEFALVPERNVVLLPDNVTDDQGAIVEPACVAVHAVDRGEVFSGSSVLVTGAGPIGVLVAMAARAAGATKVYIFEPNEKRRLRLSEIDGIKVFGADIEALKAILVDETEAGLGVDVAFECSGHEAALGTCLELVKRAGVVVQVGLFVRKPTVDMFTVAEKALRLVGSWGFPITIGARVVELISSGLLPVEKIITQQVPLEDAIVGAFDELTKPGNDHLKILIDMSR